jgi:hypothetical protein
MFWTIPEKKYLPADCRFLSSMFEPLTVMLHPHSSVSSLRANKGRVEECLYKGCVLRRLAMVSFAKLDPGRDQPKRKLSDKRSTYITVLYYQ